MSPMAAVLMTLTAGAAPKAELTATQYDLIVEAAAAFRRAKDDWAAGKRAEPIAVTEKSLAAVERVYGAHSQQAYVVRSWLATWEEDLGRWPRAIRHRDLLWGISAALHGAGDWHAIEDRVVADEARVQEKRTPEQREAGARAFALQKKAVEAYRAGRTEEALTISKEAVALHEGPLAGKHPMYGTVLSAAAASLLSLGRYKEALAAAQKAHAAMAARLGDGVAHPAFASLLNNLGEIHRTVGDYPSAVRHLRRAAALQLATMGPDSSEYATALHNLAMLYHHSGDNVAALPLMTRAVANRRRANGERDPEYASSLACLALIHGMMGDNAKALPLHQRSLKIRRETLGINHPEYATGLANLATAYGEMFEFGLAIDAAKQALALRKKRVGTRHPDYAISLHVLGVLHLAVWDLEAARPLLAEAVEVTRALGERDPKHARALGCLAILRQAEGDHEAALPLLKKALAVTGATHGERSLQYGSLLTHLAMSHGEVGEVKEAARLGDRAMALALADLREASHFSDRGYLNAARGFRRQLDACLALPDAPGTQSPYAHALVWKGAALLRQQERRLFLRLADDPATRDAAGRLQAVTRELAALKLSPSPTLARMKELQEEQERAQAALSRLSAGFREQRERERPSPEALAKALPDGVALIDYHYIGRDAYPARRGQPRPDSRFIAFVTRKGRPTARVDLTAAADLAGVVRAWRSQLVKGQDGLALGAKVKALIWSPVEKHLDGATAALISPDVLSPLPFAALPGKKAGSYLVEDIALAVIPTPQALPDLLKPRAMEAALKPSLLVVGDVDYDRAAVARADAGGVRSAPAGAPRSWGGLPATAAEAASVSRSFSLRFKGASVIALAKDAATKKAVREALAGVRYAHIATHGYFADEAVKSALAPGRPSGPFGVEGVAGWPPLLLSGLALAGANREPKGGRGGRHPHRARGLRDGPLRARAGRPFGM